jgi:Uma2 family endonuclease
MSQPAAPLPFELVYEDGALLETDWHSLELPLLRELIHQVMVERGRTDFYVGANVFVYYSVDQARDVTEEEERGLPRLAYRGPDVFWVGGADPDRSRKCWIAWEEEGRLPDVIFEMLSPHTAEKDRTEKRDLYARVLRTPEYFLYEPDTRILEGLHLAGRFYEPIQPDANGRLWSEQLGVFVGLWQGTLLGRPADDYVRLFRSDDSLVPTRVEAERQRANMARLEFARLRAEAERQRADMAESELARLRALLEERGRG